MAATKRRPGRWYSDRGSFRTYLELASTVTAKDDKLDQCIARASRFIENYTGRRFIPWTGTKEFDYQGPSDIFLGEDLLSVTSLVHNDGVDTIAAADYFLYPLNALDEDRPYLNIEVLLTDDYLVYDDTHQSAIAITAKWGYCEIKRECVSLVNDAAFSDVVTSFTADDGGDLEIGQTILIDTEQMFITNIVTNTISVERGMNGTTAAAHVNDSIIYILEPPEEIRDACEIIAARLFFRSSAAWADSVGGGEAVTRYKSGHPEEAMGILKRYRRMVGGWIRPRRAADVMGEDWYESV